MQKMTARVVMNDGIEREYPILPRVHVAYEEEFNEGVPAIAEHKKVTRVWWLAWKAMTLAGETSKPYDDWLDEFVDADVDFEDTGPFEKAPPDG